MKFDMRPIRERNLEQGFTYCGVLCRFCKKRTYADLVTIGPHNQLFCSDACAEQYELERK